MTVRKPTKKPTKKTGKPKKKPYIPQSSEAKAARQSILTADLMGIEADRARLAEVTKGVYSTGPTLRSGGSSISRYRIGKPKADPGYGKMMKTGKVPKNKPKKKR